MRVVALGLALPLLSLRPEPSATLAEGLLGRSFEAVLARLGPPEAGDGDSEMQTWRWRGAGGEIVSVSVHRGSVVHVRSPRPDTAIEPRPFPAKEVYPGQPLPAALELLGNPERVGARATVLPPSPGARGPSHTAASLVYGKRHVLVADGRVLRVHVEVDRFDGPR